MVKLGDTVKISKGKKHEPLRNGHYRYINIEDLHNHKNRVFTNEKGTLASENDVIIAWDGANAGKVGVGFSGVIGSTLAKLELTCNDLFPRFLFWYLEACNDLIKSQRTGATIPHVNGGALKSLQIPLPPLATQKRIAAILDAADALRRKDQALLQKYDELAQAIFVDMFGDPVKNEKGWEVKSLDQIVQFPSGLVNPKLAPYCNMFHVGGDNIESKTGRIFGLKKASELNLISGKFHFSGQHILYNKIRPYLNKVALPDFEGICSADMYPLLAKESEILKEYLYFVLRSDYFLDFAEKQSRRANIPKINMNEMKLFEIPVPPIQVQQNFTSFLEKKNEINSNADQNACFSETLFQSLLQKAFNAELVP